MRVTLFIFFIFIFFMACKSKQDLPANVLPQLQMQSVLWDMMRADQFISNYLLVKNINLDKEYESIKLYQQIFTIHHTNKEQFKTSLSFYRSHPVLLKPIMDSLSNKKIVKPVEIVKPKPVTDSTSDKIKVVSDSQKQLIKDKKIPDKKIAAPLKKTGKHKKHHHTISQHR